MLEDAAIFQTLHGLSWGFFFFFWGKQRDFSASEQHETLEGCILEKVYGNIFMLSKTKDAEGFVTKGKFLHWFCRG